jgi:hypothetical protein
MACFTFDIKCDGAPDIVQEVSDFIRPALQPLQDGRWVTYWVDSPVLFDNLESGIRLSELDLLPGSLTFGGEADADVPRQLVKRLAERWADLTIWYRESWDNGDVVHEWRFQGTECQFWNSYIESRYDTEGKMIGWNRRTYVRDGHQCGPPKVEMEVDDLANGEAQSLTPLPETREP